MMRIILFLLSILIFTPTGDGRVEAMDNPSMTYEDIVFDTVLEQGLDSVMANLVLAQARFESGNFKSRLFLNHNNAFGMMSPRVRKTTSLGPLARAEGRGGYASYRSLKESTIDLIYWLEYKNIGVHDSAESYCRELKKKNYYGAPLKLYTKGVKFYYDNSLQKPLRQKAILYDFTKDR